MAVNIAEISTVYNALETEVKTTLNELFDNNDLTSPDKATVMSNVIQTLITQSTAIVVNDPLNAAKVEQAVQDKLEKAEKWVIQKDIMNNQKAMSDKDLAAKDDMTTKDLAIKQAQIEQAEADVAFNESKKTIMEYVRKDNIRAKATEQFSEFLKYISAANVIPASEDFRNIRKLITALNTGVSNPDAVATITNPSGNDYQSL